MSSVKRILIVLTLLSIGCIKEKREECCDKRDSLSVAFTKVGESKSAEGEESIENINLFIFNGEGDLINHLYLTSSGAVEVEQEYGVKTVAAIANRGVIEEGEISTLAQLRAMSGQSSLGEGGNFIYCGESEHLFAPNSKSVIVPLRRLVAKVTYLFNKSGLDPNITIRIDKIELYNVPKECNYFLTNRAIGSSQVKKGEMLEGANLEPSSHQSATPLYLFENRQGVMEPEGGSQVKLPTSNIEGCSYVEITAHYNSATRLGEVKYRGYLGGNSLNNFDVEREHHYREEILFIGDGLGEGGWRVDQSKLLERLIIPSTIILDREELELECGETLQLITTVLPEGAFYSGLIWESSDNSVATVNSNGKVTAVKGGIATITVKIANSSIKAHCLVIVEEKLTISLLKFETNIQYNQENDEAIARSLFLAIKLNLPYPSNMAIVNEIASNIEVRVNYSYLKDGALVEGWAELQFNLVNNWDNVLIPPAGSPGHSINFEQPIEWEELIMIHNSFTASLVPGSKTVGHYRVSW